MKFSWQWLNTLIDLQNRPLSEILDKLTLAGFEIDDIENQPKIEDITVNISITANRADTTHMIGLARELSTILNVKLLHQSHSQYNINIVKPEISTSSQFSSNSISDIQLTYINNLNSISSPKWLQNYLLGCDIIPQNTLFDIVQYINLKWGQDIEIFDTKEIENNAFNINLIKITDISYNPKDIAINKLSKKNTNIKLEGLKYKNKTISILGLESNSNISCKANTSSIIVLGHICKPIYITHIVQLLKYKTEKSYKHMKGISRNDFSQAYEETINLIFELANNDAKTTYTSLYKWYEAPTIIKTISFPKQQIDDILGPLNDKKNYITTKEIIKTLEQLKFQPKYHNNKFSVTIPEHRNTDITRAIDVIEEIGRIYGFNQFTTTIIPTHKQGNSSKINIFINKIRVILRSIGLNEVIHYSIENQYNNEAVIKLCNPLLEDQTHLRHNLIYNLLDTATYNNKQTNTHLECFEIGKVFQKKVKSYDKQQYIENIHAAGIIGKREFSKISWSTKGQMLSWFQAKGLLETLFEHLHAKIKWTKINNFSVLKEYHNFVNICHFHRCAILKNQNTEEVIGIFSELNIKHAKQLTKQHRTYIFELNLLNLIKAIEPTKHLNYIWQKYSNYPSVIRDISLISNKNTEANIIQKNIFSSHPLIESVEIFNEYYLKNNFRSISFRITYRSNNRTLNDHDIQTIDINVQNLLKQIK